MNTLGVMKQALEALLSWTPTFKIAIDRRDDAITNLRAAIEQMEKVEPSVWLNLTTKDCTFDPRIKDNWIQQGHAVKSYYKHPAPAVPDGPTFEESKGNCLRAAHGGID